MTTLPDWPYPRWLAHRGAGKLAPENTLAAFRVGAGYGFRMFECDVKLSSDAVPFLLHDATLTRTTAARRQWGEHLNATAGDYPWSALSQLDAGSWHSRSYAGETIPTFAAIAHYCIANGFALNVEIKPTPGTERHTGEVAAEHAAHLWRDVAVKPLLSSFAIEALEGAKSAEPDLPRALLLDTPRKDWLEIAKELGCRAIICNYALWDETTVAQAKGAGFRTMSYTVNDEWAAQRLIDLGTDGIITDRVDLFSPANEGLSSRA